MARTAQRWSVFFVFKLRMFGGFDVVMGGVCDGFQHHYFATITPAALRLAGLHLPKALPQFLAKMQVLLRLTHH